MSRGRLLILSPAFHDYWRPIGAAFTRLGWDTAAVCYDDALTLSAKVRVKLRGELPARLGCDDGWTTRHHSVRAREAVRAIRPDRVLVIKGDTLTEPFLDALDRRRIPRSLWLYDELRRTAHTPNTLGRYDTIASYSARDTRVLSSRGHQAAHVLLAFDTDLRYRRRQVNEITFVGARYPTREQLLRRLAAAEVNVRAHGRQWSDHLVDRLRTWRITSPEISTGRDLSRADAYGLMAGSPATLNLHGDQDGFTMRTFEAAGAGGVELIDRRDLADLYEPGTEVVPFGDIDELIDLARRAVRDDRWGDAIRTAARRRTLAEHTFDHRARALEASWG
ncbi:MAG: glycosyltransferase [Propioniciclava sp.]